MLGSLRRKANRDIKKHLNANHEINKYRKNNPFRWVDFFYKDRSILWFISLYLISVIVVLNVEVLFIYIAPFLAICCSQHLQLSKALDTINPILLTTQVTLVAIVIPIAVTLVSIVLQKEVTQYSLPTLRAYYQQSRAFEIILSSFLLIIILILNQFLPIYHMLDCWFIYIPSAYSELFLTIIHGVWLVMNIVMTWSFLWVSLDYISPDRKIFYLKRFSAEKGLQEDLEKRLFNYLCQHPVAAGLLHFEEKKDAPLIWFSTDNDMGNVECEIYKGNIVVLKDIRFSLLKMVILRWHNEEKKNFRDPSNMPALIFPVSPKRHYNKNIILCRRSGKRSLTWFEKLIIRHSFIFMEAEE